MAIVVYSNGIVEEMLPLDSVFTDRELVESFDGYNKVKSHRLVEIANTWCLWGEISDPPDQEFNKLASDIVDYDIFSHLIFIHDSEINPNWNMTDKILYHNYKKFTEDLAIFIQDMMKQIAEENKKEYEESDTTSMIFLSALGHTKDKRVLFSFNPNEQSENFYIDGGWEIFSNKIFEYLTEYFDKEPIEENKPFVIYSDSKTIVIIEDQYVDEVTSKMIEIFQSKERYEDCSIINDITNKWRKRKTLPKQIDASVGSIKKKRGRPPKNKAD